MFDKFKGLIDSNRSGGSGTTTTTITPSAPAHPTVSYPDSIAYLPGTEAASPEGIIPHQVAAYERTGNMQVHLEAAAARTETQPFAGKMSELEDSADDQTRVRDREHENWELSRDEADETRTVLGPFRIHSGVMWKLIYWFGYVGFLAGDVIGAALALESTGDPFEKGVWLALAVGLATVTIAKIGDDVGRWKQWTRIQGSFEDQPGADLIRATFAYPDMAKTMVTRIGIAAVIAAVAIGSGMTIIRSIAAEAPEEALAFGLWAFAIFAGSFSNAYKHADPADEAIVRREADAKKAKKNRDAAPTGAIEKRAHNQRAIAEILVKHRATADALFDEQMARAAEFLAQNPALNGHGADGRSYVLTATSCADGVFGALAEEFQIPRYMLTREGYGSSEASTETSTADVSDEDIDNVVNIISAISNDDTIDDDPDDSEVAEGGS